MKLSTLMLTVILLTQHSEARTWTSADGEKTFEGEYISSTSKSVTLIKGKRKTSIRISRLSTADQAWINQEQLRDTSPLKKKSAQPISKQVVGKRLINQTFRATEKRFVTQNITKSPQYYFLYYSASW